LSQGKLWARAVPGFEVITPNGTIKDLGTEFGMEVDFSQLKAVHVFEGRVAVSPAADEKQPASSQVLNKGQAVTFDDAGVAEPITRADPQAFVRPEQFAKATALVANESSGQEHVLLQDPSLVAHFLFADADGKPVIHPLSKTQGVERQATFGDNDSTIVPPTMVPGRRPDRLAMQYEPRLAQRAQIQVGPLDILDFSDGGKGAEPLTVAVWVRAASVQSATKGACIVTRGLDNRRQYGLDIDNGVFRFFLFNKYRQGIPYEIHSRVAPDGQWHLIAGTFEPTSGVMRMYVDGKYQGSAPGPRVLMPPDAGLYIGSQPGSSTSEIEYSLDGAVDEVALWRRALNGVEIASLYRSGG
jgi:hypothetical protein